MRVLVTRAAEDAAELTAGLEALGVEPVLVPLIRKEVVPGAIAQVRAPFGWLVLTSTAAVDAVRAALEEGWDPPSKVAAVGPTTARRAEAIGLHVDLVPAEHTGAALAARLGDLPGRRVLYPRAERVPPETVDALRASMAEVVDVVAYRNVAPPDLPGALQAAWPVDLATLLSGSAARRLLAGLLAAGLSRVPCVVIGPSTARAARELGLSVVGVADPPGVPGVIEAVRRWTRGKG